jgi:hypothetical protein
VKDLIIPARRVHLELRWLSGCLIAALLVNAFAIHHYRRPWSELLTESHRMLLVALLLWLLSALARGALAGVLALARKARGARQ